MIFFGCIYTVYPKKHRESGISKVNQTELTIVSVTSISCFVIFTGIYSISLSLHRIFSVSLGRIIGHE